MDFLSMVKNIFSLSEFEKCTEERNNLNISFSVSKQNLPSENDLFTLVSQIFDRDRMKLTFVNDSKNMLAFLFINDVNDFSIFPLCVKIR